MQETHTFNFLPLNGKEETSLTRLVSSFIKAGNITLVKRCAEWGHCIKKSAQISRRKP